MDILVLLTSVLIQYFAYSVSENDWPMIRHDPQMTGHTSLKGEMIQPPEVIWKRYLGLWRNYLVVTASP